MGADVHRSCRPIHGGRACDAAFAPTAQLEAFRRYPQQLMIEIRTVEDNASIAAARSLVRAHIAAHSAVHDAEAVERVVAALPKPYVAPRGVLWVAWEDEEALGCVALHELAPDTAELKRMYVRPESRGRGVARRLTEHAIAVATARGYSRLRLGTLPDMHAAQHLYASLGFRRVPAYRSVEFGETWFYERPLGAPKEPGT